MRKKTLLLFMLLFAVSLALDACKGCSSDDTPTVTVNAPIDSNYLANCGIQTMQVYIVVSERVNGNWENYGYSISTVQANVGVVSIGGVEVPDNGNEIKIGIGIVANDCSDCCTNGSCYQGGYVSYQAARTYTGYSGISGGVVDFTNIIAQGCA